MNNFAVTSALPAAIYPRVASAAATLGFANKPAEPAMVARPIAPEVPTVAQQSVTQQGAALPATAASASDESAADGQSEQQAQIQRQLSQVEAELLRVTLTEIRELASRDREVRAHEQAHKAVGGQYAGAVSYSYERGPNGRLYAVGGSVAIDTAPVPGDPAATLQKLQQVQRAALAPAQPSSQDLAVAAQAAQAIAQARSELAADALDAAGESETKVDSADQAVANGDADKSLEVYRQVGAADIDASPLLQAQA